MYECYSQNKDELILGFILRDNKEFYMICSLGSEFSSLHFSREMHRARRNTITLFDEIIGKEVEAIRQYENERAFSIRFEGNLNLVFKLFGNRANILLFNSEQLLKIFKNNLKQDFAFVPQDRTLTFSIDTLQEKRWDFLKLFFTFDPLFVRYLNLQGYEQAGEQEKFRMLEQLLHYLDHPVYYVTKVSGKTVLSLFDLGEVLSVHRSPVEAANAFYAAHFRYNFLQSKTERITQAIQAGIKATRAYLDRSVERLQELESERSPAEIADLIMAHLHEIQPGTERIKLADFYTGGETEIKLKKDLSPQKNAELLYRKAKGKPMELQKLREQIVQKQERLEALTQDLSRVASISSHKETEEWENKYLRGKEKESMDVQEKFRVYEVMGFKILVGRHAENNDELTQKFAHKNDLWLHARDVAGSHVVIKHQAGKKIPKPVIEAAASLAAYYSKRKNDTLCPVLYTEKKFVRKIKGAPKGEMKVERETVIMVPPRDITS